MPTRNLHRWDLSPREAIALQKRLSDRLLELPLEWDRLRRVAGCDVGIRDDRLFAAVVVLDLASLQILEIADVERRVAFPYVPGLLSFREVPALLEAFERLRHRPDVVLCDGQGLAHPRRLGLACHLGLILDLPTVGVAKSRLTGKAREPGPRRGNSTVLRDGDETIGRLLRTRASVRPLYISVGHRITLDDAVRLVLRTGAGFRLPEPTRLADKQVRFLGRGEPGLEAVSKVE